MILTFDEIIEKYKIVGLSQWVFMHMTDKPYHGIEHTKRVVERSYAIASKTGIPEREMIPLLFAALWHDYYREDAFDNARNVKETIKAFDEHIPTDRRRFPAHIIERNDMAKEAIRETEGRFYSTPKTRIGKILHDADITEAITWGVDDCTKKLDAEGFYAGMTVAEKWRHNVEFLKTVVEDFCTDAGRELYVGRANELLAEAVAILAKAERETHRETVK